MPETFAGIYQRGMSPETLAEKRLCKTKQFHGYTIAMKGISP